MKKDSRKHPLIEYLVHGQKRYKKLQNTCYDMRNGFLAIRLAITKVPADGNVQFQTIPVNGYHKKNIPQVFGKISEIQEKYQQIISYHLKNMEQLWVYASFKSQIVLGVQYQGVGNFKTITSGSNRKRSLCGRQKMMSHVTTSFCRPLDTLTEVEEPEEMGKSLGTGAHRHRSILIPGVKYVPGRGCFDEYCPTGPRL